MQRLILIRHGETNKNVQGNIHDPNDPEELNVRGVEQMHLTAEQLVDVGVDRVYSSNQLRAIQSGQIVADTLLMPLTIVEGMRERQWGEFAGRPWDEVEATLQKMPLDERFVYTPPGGESWKVFEGRLAMAVTTILRENPEKTIVIVTHGGAIRALIPYLLGIPRSESFKHQPRNASVTMFEIDELGTKLVKVDERAYT